MRPIKFRAWSYSLQKMVYVSIEAMDFGLYSLDSSWDECIRPFDSEDSDCELMQFTGLLDKNGKEIWEGDLIIPWGCKQIYTVSWHNYGWHLTGKFLKYPRELRWTEDYEVIGNIWENKKLIKE